MPPQLAKLSAALIQKANKKESIRAEVNQRNGANAFAYYSELNRDALDIVNESILRINNESVRDHLAVMYYLARLKEHLGQVRGKLNGVLAKKILSPQAKSEITGFYNDIQRYQQLLIGNINNSSEIRALFNSVEAKQMDEIVNLVFSNEDPSRWPSPSQWFAMATSYITAVKTIADNKQALIQQETQQNMTSAQQNDPTAH